MAIRKYYSAISYLMIFSINNTLSSKNNAIPLLSLPQIAKSSMELYPFISAC